MVYANWLAFRDAREQAITQVRQLVAVAVREQEQWRSQSAALLAVLEEQVRPVASDAGRCSAFLARALGSLPGYANVSTTDLNGEFVCSVSPLPGRANISNTPLHRRILQTPEFTVGVIRPSPISGRVISPFAHPLRDNDGRLRGIITLAVDLGWLERLVREMDLPRLSTVTVIDGSGTILLRFPEPEKWVGQVVGAVVVFLDITQRKQADEAIRRTTAELEQRVAERTARLEAIRVIGLELSSQVDLVACLDLIVRRTTELLGATLGGIYLWDERGEILSPVTSAWIGTDFTPPSLRPGEGLAGTAALRRETAVVDDYASSPYAVIALPAPHLPRAFVATPLMSKGRLIGVLAVGRDGPGRAFTKEDIELVELVAAQAAITIDNAGLLAAQRRSAERFRAILTQAVDPIVTIDDQPSPRRIRMRWGRSSARGGICWG